MEAGFLSSFSQLGGMVRFSHAGIHRLGDRSDSCVGGGCQPGSWATTCYRWQVREVCTFVLPSPAKCAAAQGRPGGKAWKETSAHRSVPSHAELMVALWGIWWCRVFMIISQILLLSVLGLILGGIEGKYLGKDYMRRRHINLSSWLNFVIFTNVEHIWSGIPFDLFTAFVSYICRGFPTTDTSFIWPGSVFCTESPV